MCVICVGRFTKPKKFDTVCVCVCESVYETEKVWHRLCVCVCVTTHKRKLDRYKKQRKHVDNEYGMARDSVG